jgi:hypothetical protein
MVFIFTIEMQPNRFVIINIAAFLWLRIQIQQLEIYDFLFFIMGKQNKI